MSIQSFLVVLVAVSLSLAIPSHPALERSEPLRRQSTNGTGSPCAIVSSSVASIFATSPSATPTIPAELAHDCITSVPLHTTEATELLDSILPYVQWQSTLSYLKAPPAEYVEKIQNPVDVYGEIAAIRDNVASGAYQSEYEFGFNLYVESRFLPLFVSNVNAYTTYLLIFHLVLLSLAGKIRSLTSITKLEGANISRSILTILRYRVFQTAHDGHFAYSPDVVSGVFTFGRPVILVSASPDGQAVPEIYVYTDVLASSFGNATYNYSSVTGINGQDATEYLLDWSQNGNLQDRDALWNNVFYELSQVLLGSTGTGTGTFSGGGRGRYIYSGPTTTLTFSNGTTNNYTNFARVLKNFDGVQSGDDLYNTYFTYPASDRDTDGQDYSNITATITSVAASTATSAASATSTSMAVTTTTTLAAPGYPSPVLRHSLNLNAGYYLDSEPDVAVLSVNSFVGTGDDSVEQEFQQVNQQFIQEAKAAGKTRLIIDVGANSGGTILQGYDLFKILFPAILPQGNTRFRGHESVDLIGRQFSAVAGQYPRTLADDNDTLAEIEYDIVSSIFNYRTDVDINYENFASWPDKYGPNVYNGDNFTNIIRWNLSDVLTPYNSGGIYVHPTIPGAAPPFAPEDIIVVSNGYCASTCTIFSELMRQQAGVRYAFVGGRPNTALTQAVGGVKGTNDFPWDYIKFLVDRTWSLADPATVQQYQSSALNTYNLYALDRAVPGSYAVNFRDGIRQGDTSEVPVQFRYEPADCRVFYTPEMTVDITALWTTVADATWGNGNGCVAGGLNNSTTSAGRIRRSGRKPTVTKRANQPAQLEALLRSLDVQTDPLKMGMRGDGLMFP